jgi:phospholipase/lecithinase/hemolysin
MKRRICFGVVFGLMLLVIGTPIHATPISGVVAFGDSLSDNGNLYRYTRRPPAPYYEGRFSNGPVWVEYLTDKLDSPLDDRAFGGATTSNYNYATGQDNWGLKWQIDNYLATPPPSNAHDLYTVWAGANDFFANPTTDPSVSVNNIGYALERLSNAGARKILIINVPDLGTTPAYSKDANMSALATAWSTDFNDALTSSLAVFESTFNGHLYTIDAFTAFDAIASQFLNTTDAYLSDGLIAGLNPDDFVYWDGVHATTRAHHLLAGIAHQTIAPIPEPATLILLGVGIIGLAGLGRKKFFKRKMPLPDSVVEREDSV